MSRVFHSRYPVPPSQHRVNGTACARMVRVIGSEAMFAVGGMDGADRGDVVPVMEVSRAQSGLRCEPMHALRTLWTPGFEMLNTPTVVGTWVFSGSAPDRSEASAMLSDPEPERVAHVAP